MPSTINFLDPVLRSIKAGPKRQLYWCNGCPGFGLRVTPSGAKTFVFKYMKKRRSRWITIGRYPEWSIRSARKQYDTLYEQVYAYGRDPMQELHEHRTAEENRDTVASFTKTYLDVGRLKNKTFIDEEERYFRQDIWPVIGEKRLEEVSAEDIDRIQRQIIARSKNKANATRSGKVAAKHAIACVRRLFNLAIKRKKCSTNPVAEIELLGITGARDRVLTLKEIWLFWNKLDEVGLPPVTAAALKFALVTMQRGTEVRNMRYRSLKLDESVWQMEMHETKNRTMHRVPLNRHALALIEQVRPYTGSSPFVFGATRSKKAPRTPEKALSPFGKTAFSQAVRRSRELLRIENFCPHDLRRTGATWITAAGLPKLYARLMLNHSDGDRDVTGEVYVQYSYDFEKRRAAQVWEFVLDQVVSAKTVDDVPTLDELRRRVKEAQLL